jgi:hypothetical protein
MIAQLGSMACALLMPVGARQQHKPKTNKRAADDTLGDEYAEKRVKTNCWERSEDEKIEANRARRRARSISFQSLMAGVDRVHKDAEEYIGRLRTQEHKALQQPSCWSRIWGRAVLEAINLLRIVHVLHENQSGRKTRRFLSSRSRQVLPATG